MRKKGWGPEGVKHPAVFSAAHLDTVASMLDESHRRILDPFAGVGQVHKLADVCGWPVETLGVELEPEWAACHPRTVTGNALELAKIFGDAEPFDAIVTSPAYGNRLADKHNAKDGSYRRSYTFDLGRQLAADNSGGMQWGANYRALHEQVWRQCRRVLRPGGRLVLNMSDHIRAKRRRYVTAWHVSSLAQVGFRLADAARLETRRMGFGANRDVRVPSEMVLAFDWITDDEEAH